MMTFTMPTWIAKNRILIAQGDARPRIMGIVNTTPDSFSDGGLAFASEAATARSHRLVAQGADFLDIGGESTRPNAEIVPASEELRRVLPVLESLVDALTVPISVDTTKAEVAKEAIALGVSVINDITALSDPEMARTVADSDVGVVLMHMRGNPRTMQIDPNYDDVVEQVYDYLSRRVEACEAMGIGRERIAIDPGIGFGKTQEHNLTLLRQLSRFGAIGCVLLVGVSRKGLLGLMTGRERSERATASAVCSLFAAEQGAQVLRVHDVDVMSDAIKVWTELKGWESRPG